MNYILIDDFNGSINILCKDDGSGEPEVFDSLPEAKKALPECQSGIIVPLGDAISMLEEAHRAIGMARFELEEEWDENNLEGRLGDMLNLPR